MRIFRQASVKFRMFNVVEDIHNVRAADAGRIVKSGIGMSCMFAKLRRALLAKLLHIVFRSEVQTSRRTRFDASRFKPGADPVRTQSALMNLLRFRIKLRNIERAAGHAVLAADAIVLVKVDDAICILHDGAVSRTGAKTSRVGTMQAAILAHQPTESAVVGNMLIEADQVVIIPFQIWHGLVGIIKNRFPKRIAIPLKTSDFARFAQCR